MNWSLDCRCRRNDAAAAADDVEDGDDVNWQTERATGCEIWRARCGRRSDLPRGPGAGMMRQGSERGSGRSRRVAPCSVTSSCCRCEERERRRASELAERRLSDCLVHCLALHRARYNKSASRQRILRKGRIAELSPLPAANGFVRSRPQSKSWFLGPT